jgi:hypothetical protein
MLRKVINAGGYLATMLAALVQFAHSNTGVASPTPEKIAQEALLEARINDARAKLIGPLGTDTSGLPRAGKLAQWFNWPNWQNWGNGWRNW